MSLEINLNQTLLSDYRNETYRFLNSDRISSASQAVDFANERGFIFFWPNKGVELPSLWGAVAGNRPVPNNHDDPAHITWTWKDQLLGKKRWYYGRILARRNTIISLDLLPSFYALSPNYGTPAEDYLIEYQQGSLSQEERIVYETLLENGALNTLALRKEAHLSSSENTSRFNRALDNLQRDFRILPIGTAEAGAWHYAYVFDVVHRNFPDLISQAHPIKKIQAMQSILESYFLSVGAARFMDIQKLFRWSKEDILHVLDRLIADQFILQNIQLTNQTGEWFALTGLLSRSVS